MGKNKNKDIKNKKHKGRNTDSVWFMSHAPSLDKGYHWTQNIPVIIFTAVIIMITFMKTYHSPMEGYYWHSDTTIFNDFFSYYKSIFIILMGTLAILMALYRLMTQTLIIKKTKLYIPMTVYVIFVILSWFFSEYPYFALRGFNDRFEGSLVLISYIIMLFFTINTINTERTVKWTIYAAGISSSVLGILGITQFLRHDFFQTEIGKKLITPSTYTNLDKLKFHFTKGEIYQTVYNINYVSFYLTLLIPVFGLLFITEKNIKKKLIFGAVSALLIFNLIGSKSSGGILGIGIAFIVALIILNKKLLKWWKSIALVLAAVILVFAMTFNVLMPEITRSIRSAFTEDADIIHKQFIDYFDTDYDKLTISCNNEPLTINVNLDNPNRNLSFEDKEGNELTLTKEDDAYRINEDSRFSMYSFKFVREEDDRNFIVVYIEDSKWPFEITGDGILFYNALDKHVELHPVPGIGFENQLDFGSGRGLIWSRSLPLIKDHIFIGSGADTYVFEFPQNDYAAKYNADWPIYNIVDKPHNMYIGIAVNTGLISLISLLVLFGAYIISSIKIYRKNEYEDFISIVGAGIFIGICGFLVAGLVNDSSVSVMPLFYGLLGVGIAINFKLEKQV